MRWLAVAVPPPQAWRPQFTLGLYRGPEPSAVGTLPETQEVGDRDQADPHLLPTLQTLSRRQGLDLQANLAANCRDFISPVCRKQTWEDQNSQAFRTSA